MSEMSPFVMSPMIGWNDSGAQVSMRPEQAHVVLVLLGRREPDAAFDRFWRMRGVGKSTVVFTAGRYAGIEGEYNDLMWGLGDLGIGMHDITP